MILYRWQGQSTNFGDELNTILWPRLLPDFFDGNPAVRFLGIGSVLDRRHSPPVIKVVAGAGYGGYERKPRLDDKWIFHWVRGPRTAAALALPASLALGDPAVLVPATLGLRAGTGEDIGFMPHFESAAWGEWQQVADRAGVRLIDPRTSPHAIMQALGSCKMLLSEALHGVIVADAMRVPWVAIRPSNSLHRPKWRDWGDTMDLGPQFIHLPVSTMFEWAGASRFNAFHVVRKWLGRREHALRQLSSERFIARASHGLYAAAKAAPQLSTATALDRCQSRMLEAVCLIRNNPLRGLSAAPVPRSCLHGGDDSAYQLTPIGCP